MTRFLATLLASAALSTLLPLQARAELDVVSLKSAIERSVESDYPKLDALYKDIHAKSLFRRRRRQPSWLPKCGPWASR
jgi:hippurate hydrolase